MSITETEITIDKKLLTHAETKGCLLHLPARLWISPILQIYMSPEAGISSILTGNVSLGSRQAVHHEMMMYGLCSCMMNWSEKSSTTTTSQTHSVKLCKTKCIGWLHFLT